MPGIGRFLQLPAHYRHPTAEEVLILFRCVDFQLLAGELEAGGTRCSVEVYRKNGVHRLRAAIGRQGIGVRDKGTGIGAGGHASGCYGAVLHSAGGMVGSLAKKEIFYSAQWMLQPPSASEPAASS